MSESSFRTRAREIAGYLYSINLPYSTRFFAAPACGPPRTFSRGDGVSENRPAVEDDIQPAAAQCTGDEPRARQVLTLHRCTPWGPVPRIQSKKPGAIRQIYRVKVHRKKVKNQIASQA